MNVLLTGNVSLLSEEMLDKLSETYQCVVCDNKNKKLSRKRKLIYYNLEEQQDEMDKLFATFDFEAVIFVSYTVDGAVKVFDELEKLENTIYASRRGNVKYFIYITSNDLVGQNQGGAIRISREVLMRACDDLCTAFSEGKVMHFTTMKVPYVYALHNGENQLYRWIHDAVYEHKVCFRGHDFTETDFLCDLDLGELILRILDEPGKQYYQELQISGENKHSYQEVADDIRREYDGFETDYMNLDSAIPQAVKNNIAREEYGWFPLHRLEDDIPVITEDILQKKKQTEREKNRKKWNHKYLENIRIGLELLVLFVIAELLTYSTRNNILINFLNFRMLFILIMGLTNGLTVGVAAATLSTISYFLGKSQEVSWQILFYNVENWLPFASYFLLGAVAGYTKERYTSAITHTKEQLHLLENKYIFLRDLYEQVIKSKNQYNSQIIGYKESFGKIYSVVHKLDSALPDQVFYEAVDVLEELLNNQTVAIYVIAENSDFARLSVCSKSLNNFLGKSLRLSDYPELKAALDDKKVFVNTKGLKDYPQYVAPIMREDSLLGMIQLTQAKESQLNMEFFNKFSVISNLIRDSLVHAMEREQYSKKYLDGTLVLKPKYFEEILEVKAQMRRKQYMDYQLLKIRSNGEDIEQIQKRVSNQIRNNDVLGMREDGFLYLLLSQTREEDLGRIKERMSNNQIMFDVVKG